MKQTLMTRIGALAAFVLAALLGSLPASAASFIQDGAQMFSPDTVAQLNAKIGSFNAQTGKSIVVVTVPSLNGETVADAAHQVFNEQHINGVLIFIAKNDRRDIIVPGTATAQFFPQSTNASIRQSMESLFKAEDYDGGVTAAVNGVLDVFRAHLNQQAPGANYPATTSQTTLARSNSGAHIPVFMWIIIFVIGYLVLRSIFRAMSGPRYYGGPGAGPGMPGPGYPPAGYGGPGYYGGGGGGFWSGLLGGLGGAWLGNELFGNRGGNTIIEQGGNAPMVQGGDQGGGWGGGNAGGWGQDSGADMGNASSGDWSGGGFGGGGDSGGGWGGFGGGDSGGGGGGGDSGGGW